MMYLKQLNQLFGEIRSNILHISASWDDEMQNILGWFFSVVEQVWDFNLWSALQLVPGMFSDMPTQHRMPER